MQDNKTSKAYVVAARCFGIHLHRRCSEARRGYEPITPETEVQPLLCLTQWAGGVICASYCMLLER